MKLFVKNVTDPVAEFWEKKALDQSKGVGDGPGLIPDRSNKLNLLQVDEPNGLKTELLITLGIAWVLCYFCIWKGVKWTGKVCLTFQLFSSVRFCQLYALYIRHRQNYVLCMQRKLKMI